MRATWGRPMRASSSTTTPAGSATAGCDQDLRTIAIASLARLVARRNEVLEERRQRPADAGAHAFSVELTELNRTLQDEVRVGRVAGDGPCDVFETAELIGWAV